MNGHCILTCSLLKYHCDKNKQTNKQKSSMCVVDRIMGSQIFPLLRPGTCECTTLHGQGDLVGAVSDEFCDERFSWNIQVAPM